MLHVSVVYSSIAEWCSIVWMYHGLLSIHQLWAFGLFPVWGYYKYSYCKYSHLSLCPVYLYFLCHYFYSNYFFLDIWVCISYLWLCNKNTPKIFAENDKHSLSHSFCGSGRAYSGCYRGSVYNRANKSSIS